jgi:hypothetical protein
MSTGARVVVEGTVAEIRGTIGMINPHYEFVVEASDRER